MYDGNVIRYGTFKDVVSDYPDATGQRIRVPPNIQHLGYDIKNKFIRVREYAMKHGFGAEVAVGVIALILGLGVGGVGGYYLGQYMGSGKAIFKGLKTVGKFIQ